MSRTDAEIIAIDIGNTRIKLGRFSALQKTDGLPFPEATTRFATHDDGPPDFDGLFADHDSPAEAQWVIGSVHREATARLRCQLEAVAVPPEQIRLLDYRDIPLRIDLPKPDLVGIDRLLAAVAADRLRPTDRSAIMIDVGSAITIDWLDATGTFRGGAILPGIGMSAQALHAQTDLLPRVDLEELTQPHPPLGNDTESAIASGLFWGAIGAMRELVYRLGEDIDQQPLVVVTGGAAPCVAELLAEGSFRIDTRHEPHLVLSGIAIVSQALS